MHYSMTKLYPPEKDSHCSNVYRSPGTNVPHFQFSCTQRIWRHRIIATFREAWITVIKQWAELLSSSSSSSWHLQVAHTPTRIDLDASEPILTHIIIAGRQTRAAVLTAQEKDGSQSLTGGNLKGSASMIELSNSCPGGSSWNSASKSCRPCKRGTAKFDKGPGQCKPCSKGVAPVPGCTVCSPCPKGSKSYDKIKCV